MKNILLFSLLFTSLCAVEWRGYDKALALQKISKKPIMLEVVRTHCHYCEDMERDVFAKKEMKKWIESRFIPVKLNLDNTKLPLGLQVSFTPTFFFINSHAEIMKKIPGSWNQEDFCEMTQGVK